MKFQNDYVNDVNNVYKAFPNNPFEINILTVVNKNDAEFDDNIFHNLSKLISTGSEQVQKYIRERLITSRVSINKKISLNHFVLPVNENSKKKKGSLIDK